MRFGADFAPLAAEVTAAGGGFEVTAAGGGFEVTAAGGGLAAALLPPRAPSLSGMTASQTCLPLQGEMEGCCPARQVAEVSEGGGSEDDMSSGV